MITAVDSSKRKNRAINCSFCIDMTAKDKYRILCQTEASIPIYSRDWWLDIVCGADKWDVLLAEGKNGIQAAMPFYRRHPKVISMPPYTQTMGPWFAPISDDTKYASLLADKQALSISFTDRLKDIPYFLQNFHYSVTDWLPFYWAGYQQTTRYTYLLPDISDTEQLWKGMSVHLRRNIVKAKDKFRITIKRGITIDEFLSVCSKTFKRQAQKIPHPEVLRKLIEASRQHGQGELWGGYDEEGKLHAVAFVVWQENAACYLAGGGDPLLRHSGAHSLVLWECIQQMSAITRQFDFEGSMIPGVERFFREFGAIQTPYFTISKGKLSLVCRAWLKAFYK